MSECSELLDKYDNLKNKNKKLKRRYELCKIRRMNNLNHIHDLEEENNKIKKANRNLQSEIIEMLDFIKENDGVTRQEMADWWNKRKMGSDY